MLMDMRNFEMIGFDEGKDDDTIYQDTPRKTKVKNAVERRIFTKGKVASKRKNAYYKGKKRWNTLASVVNVDALRDIHVVRGLLRDHQFSLETHCPTVFDCSVATKRRMDAAEQKMAETAVV